MNDDRSEPARQIGHVAATSATVFVVFIVLYLTGFVVALKLGPGLTPPVSTVLEVVYWPFVKCHDEDIEPIKSAIEWLRHAPRPPPGNGQTMTVPAAPPLPAR